MESGADYVGGTLLLDFPDSVSPKLSSLCRELLKERIFSQNLGKYCSRNIPGTSHSRWGYALLGFVTSIWGGLRWFVALARWVFRLLARDVWLLLIALLLQHKSL